jgi:nucleoside-diphosphate-sugar epimerase
MHVLVAGAGWLGAALAREMAARGHRVTAVRRDPARAAALAAPGVEPLALDLANPGSVGQLPGGVDAIVACQSASGDGADAYRRAYVDVTATLLAAARRSGRAIALLYTGSTGVFGQRDGGEVDELTSPAPSSPAAEVLVEAERQVLGAAGPELRAMVLRLSGLYGPGRTWPVDRVRSGQLSLGPGDAAWMNLLHRDDAVEAVRLALERGQGGRVYHATDREPVRRRDLVEWVARRLGIPVPRRPEGSSAPPLPDRRILAARTRAELGWEPRYPTFREGLAPLLPAAVP